MTAKQKAARAKFKAVVKEAGKLRKKNPKLTQAEAVKQAWAISYGKKKAKVGYSKERLKIEKKATPLKKKYRAKGWSKKDAIKNALIDAAYMSGTKKAPAKSYHKDTKSHNVNIRVMSGIGSIGENFTRVNNDVNGNPRYVVHFLDLINEEERMAIPFHKLYEYAVKKAKKIGGKKYNNKSYGGGIIFQSYNIEKTWNDIQKIKHYTGKIK